ncbi:MAG: hypothetical protein HY791_06305 [Deltaproteobacteria bacterium]|nr:hypothetical protein [Deltaproteobacteria bacterium]
MNKIAGLQYMLPRLAAAPRAPELRLARAPRAPSAPGGSDRYVAPSATKPRPARNPAPSSHGQPSVSPELVSDFRSRLISSRIGRPLLCAEASEPATELLEARQALKNAKTKEQKAAAAKALAKRSDLDPSDYHALRPNLTEDLASFFVRFEMGYFHAPFAAREELRSMLGGSSKEKLAALDVLTSIFTKQPERLADEDLELVRKLAQQDPDAEVRSAAQSVLGRSALAGNARAARELAALVDALRSDSKADPTALALAERRLRKIALETNDPELRRDLAPYSVDSSTSRALAEVKALTERARSGDSAAIAALCDRVRDGGSGSAEARAALVECAQKQPRLVAEALEKSAAVKSPSADLLDTLASIASTEGADATQVRSIALRTLRTHVGVEDSAKALAKMQAWLRTDELIAIWESGSNGTGAVFSQAVTQLDDHERAKLVKRMLESGSSSNPNKSDCVMALRDSITMPGCGRLLDQLDTQDKLAFLSARDSKTRAAMARDLVSNWGDLSEAERDQVARYLALHGKSDGTSDLSRKLLDDEYFGSYDATKFSRELDENGPKCFQALEREIKTLRETGANPKLLKKLEDYRDYLKALSINANPEMAKKIDGAKLESWGKSLANDSELQDEVARIFGEVAKSSGWPGRAREIYARVGSPAFRRSLELLRATGRGKQADETLARELSKLRLADPALADQLIKEMAAREIELGAGQRWRAASRDGQTTAVRAALEALGMDPDSIACSGNVAAVISQLTELYGDSKDFANNPGKILRALRGMAIKNPELGKAIKIVEGLNANGKLSMFTTAVSLLGAATSGFDTPEARRSFASSIFSAGEGALEVISVLAKSKLAGVAGKIFGSVGAVIGAFSDAVAACQDAKEGDTAGAVSKGVSAVGGGILAVSPLFGPAAPVVAAVGVACMIGGFVGDKVFGKESWESFLVRCKIYK